MSVFQITAYEPNCATSVLHSHHWASSLPYKWLLLHKAKALPIHFIHVHSIILHWAMLTTMIITNIQLPIYHTVQYADKWKLQQLNVNKLPCNHNSSMPQGTKWKLLNVLLWKVSTAAECFSTIADYLTSKKYFFQHKVLLSYQVFHWKKNIFFWQPEKIFNPATKLITSFTSQHHSGSSQWNVFTSRVWNATYSSRHSLDTSITNHLQLVQNKSNIHNHEWLFP